MKTKILIISAFFICLINAANAEDNGSNDARARDEYVEGYYKKDGTFVKGYHRTVPDSDKSNNYSTKGNINPHNGKKGSN